ncbi:hypothetical protein KHM83_03745 [Fusibacter paucivorans]|uniref:Uncharacterized protein n=1 Tax=Fusibacter paucivorans TaxID=76009 RepID=A0ABS5PLM0_9FIRM|nr:hypothetical protein [Fusibacter paucivorans]MBS7525787.1 hypothetical protein [Fusibacter paucivorans]
MSTGKRAILMEDLQKLEQLLEAIKLKQAMLDALEVRLVEARNLAVMATAPEMIEIERMKLQKAFNQLIEEIKLLEAEATRYQ